ncbi:MULTISPECIES: glycosyltransferase family 4 protein [Dactylosporangium]|uniref:GDP-mannose-dependent alpha-mannosyltransferase n=2 Tax=Dactylosporangium TaxID=35753 RepID=A0A9W6KIJ3_9ACTN|nr:MULTISPECIES: glycosyltransferase family 1 protein [Dactylosporangium]UAB95679.1 glycosyltransferase family 1 protein [Dactylosporangium vinaceum]UWZ44035.1 glycosyltransferase family 1 protein [Dactylosporangium matsuzakiense]GLL00725.1 GDP-mannose-dependent alpha-mannosyltransferase [Dactylosporangium matsuzakiense]
MRIAIVTESFPPDVNGVAHSVVRVAEHLVARGHEPLVIAPQPSSGARSVTGSFPYPIIRVPSVATPGYGSFRLGLPSRRLAAALKAHRTDLVHLASPFVLGARGMTVAASLGLPTVAVYQTDVPAYARLYYRTNLGEQTAWRWLRHIHNAADRTLAPSTASATALHSHGIERVWLWRRGVDAARFDPGHRSSALRRAVAAEGQVIIGYVGRLAVEKRVDLLAPVSRIPGVRVVVVGDGPARANLERAMPDAVFLGERRGDQLARIFASLDLFVHTGPFETFGQTIQEALASGVPVVAPAQGGPLDLVDEGRTGLLVPPGDAPSLVAAVTSLVENTEQRLAMGVAARVAVATRTWSAVGDELIKHYVDVHSGGIAARSVPISA